MLLATKCPHCKTTFKVANDQLKLQSGLVRCGICHQVFNGIEHLAPADAAVSSVKINPTAAPEPSAAAPLLKTEIAPAAVPLPPLPPLPDEKEFDLFDMLGVDTGPANETAVATGEQQRIEPTLDEPTPQLADTFFPPLSDEFSKARSVTEFADKVQALLDADLQSEAKSFLPRDAEIEEIILTPPEEQTFSGLEATPEAVAQWPPREPSMDSRVYGDDDSAAEEEYADEPAQEEELGTYDPTQDEDIAHLLFIRQAQSRKRLTWLLAIGTVLLTLLLLGQAAFQFRNVLAAAYPKTKNALVMMCHMLQCQVRLPAMQDAISYEADELHNLPHDNTFEFSLLMRNHSSLVQAWPNIELTLKDNKKQVVLRRVFIPAAYLTNPAEELNGFQSNQEQPVKLYFVVDKVKATDYTVSIFYP